MHTEKHQQKVFKANACTNLSIDIEIAIHTSVNHSTTHSATKSEHNSCISAFSQPHEHPHRHRIPKELIYNSKCRAAHIAFPCYGRGSMV